jgi:nicotinamidase-related amidase
MCVGDVKQDVKREATPKITAQPIVASAKHDPGCRDLFQGSVKKMIAEKRGQSMHNLKIVPNDQGLVQSDFPETYPATDHLFEIKSSYSIKEPAHVRNYVLIVEDMQYEYETYVQYCVPHVKELISTFRDLKLPILWTNWARRSDDGLYGAIDRFYGAEGIDEEGNPCYVYGEKGHLTLAELAPQTDEEMSRSILSLHLSKFADCDCEGREIVFPMLEAWGVNTIVLCGAWTDDCLATTVFDAVDKYGYDVILVNNGCATATVHGRKMMEVLYAATSLDMSAQEVVEHLRAHPELVEAPKAPLRGDVYKTSTPYRRDPEIEALKQRIRELEAELQRKSSGDAQPKGKGKGKGAWNVSDEAVAELKGKLDEDATLPKAEAAWNVSDEAVAELKGKLDEDTTLPKSEAAWNVSDEAVAELKGKLDEDTTLPKM